MTQNNLQIVEDDDMEKVYVSAVLRGVITLIMKKMHI